MVRSSQIGFVKKHDRLPGIRTVMDEAVVVRSLPPCLHLYLAMVDPEGLKSSRQAGKTLEADHGGGFRVYRARTDCELGSGKHPVFVLSRTRAGDACPGARDGASLLKESSIPSIRCALKDARDARRSGKLRSAYYFTYEELSQDVKVSEGAATMLNAAIDIRRETRFSPSDAAASCSNGANSFAKRTGVSRR